MADTYTLLFEDHCPAVHNHTVKGICQRIDKAFQCRDGELSASGNDQSAQLLDLLVQAYEVILPAVAQSELQELAQSGLQGLISTMQTSREAATDGPSTPMPNRTPSKKREASQDPPPPPTKKHKAIQEPTFTETPRRSRVACIPCRKRKAKCHNPDGPSDCSACIYHGTACNQPWNNLPNANLPFHTESATGFNHVDPRFFSPNFAPPSNMQAFQPMMPMPSDFGMGMPMDPPLPFGMSNGPMYQLNAGTAPLLDSHQGQSSGDTNAVTSQLPFLPFQPSYGTASLSQFQSSGYPNTVSNQVPFQNEYSLPSQQSYHFGAFQNGNEPIALGGTAASNSSVLHHRNVDLDRPALQDHGESRNSRVLPPPRADDTGRLSAAEHTTAVHDGDGQIAAETDEEGDTPSRPVIDLTESPISTVDRENGSSSRENTTPCAENQTNTPVAPQITLEHQNDRMEPPAYIDSNAAGSADSSPVVHPEDHFELAIWPGISDEVSPGLDASSTMLNSSNAISDIDHTAGNGHSSGSGYGTSASLGENTTFSLAFPEPVWPPPAMPSNDEEGDVPAGGRLAASWTIDDTNIIFGQVELLEDTDDEFSDEEEEEEEEEEASDSLHAVAGSAEVENFREDGDVGENNGFDENEWAFDDLFDMRNAEN